MPYLGQSEAKTAAFTRSIATAQTGGRMIADQTCAAQVPS